LSRNLTAIWIAAVAGAALAVIAWFISLLCFGIWLDGVSVGTQIFFNTPVDWVYVLYVIAAAALGAVVGLTLWGIARPDKMPRPVQP
jgi:hypothetical protein